jgi:hypothetical protein
MVEQVVLHPLHGLGLFAHGVFLRWGLIINLTSSEKATIRNKWMNKIKDDPEGMFLPPINDNDFPTDYYDIVPYMGSVSYRESLLGQVDVFLNSIPTGSIRNLEILYKLSKG